eukprot:9457810-Pyramimonas_sp.AAC.1
MLAWRPYPALRQVCCEPRLSRWQLQRIVGHLVCILEGELGAGRRAPAMVSPWAAHGRCIFDCCVRRGNKLQLPASARARDSRTHEAR